jgi:hypothetical protein
MLIGLVFFNLITKFEIKIKPSLFNDTLPGRSNLAGRSCNNITHPKMPSITVPVHVQILPNFNCQKFLPG